MKLIKTYFRFVDKEYIIREVKDGDIANLTAIYNHYVENTVITFDLEMKSEQTFLEEVNSISVNHYYLVLEDDGNTVGYAYAGTWRKRPAYDHTLESSIYIHPDHFGKGYGRALYNELIEQVANGEVKSLVAGIALPNEASIKLHESMGFQKVAHFKKVGFKFGQWIDVAYWQLMLK